MIAILIACLAVSGSILILAFGDQWQSQVSAFGRGLNQSSSSP